MKVYRYILFLVGGVLLMDCSITSKPEIPKKDYTNKLLINGVEDEIKFAEMVSYTKLPANKNYKFELIFHTGSTEAVYQPTWYYTGQGGYFKFSLWSQDSTIASGTYTIDGSVNQDFSITKAAAELNVNWSTGESDFGSYLNGSVQLENLGAGKYKIDINCTDYEENPVTAFYEGDFYNLNL